MWPIANRLELLIARSGQSTTLPNAYADGAGGLLGGDDAPPLVLEHNMRVIIHAQPIPRRTRSQPSLSFTPNTINTINTINNNNNSNSNSNNSVNILTFDPKDGSFDLDSQFDDYAPTYGTSYHAEIKIHALVGLLDLSTGSYLFYITHRTPVASFSHLTTSATITTTTTTTTSNNIISNNNRSHSSSSKGCIYRVDKVAHVPVYRKPHLSLAEEQEERDSLRAVMAILNSGNMYFSYDFDLTSRLQRSVATTTTTDMNQVGSQRYSVVNEAYWWNRSLQLKWIESRLDCSMFIVPLIAGHVSQIPLSLPCNTPTDISSDTEKHRVWVEATLISRIHRKRVGTRYMRRGLDFPGYAAMHVETELILHPSTTTGATSPKTGTGLITSHVQVRASVPWIWKHELDMGKYKPDILVRSEQCERSRAAVLRHFDMLRREYGLAGPVGHPSIHSAHGDNNDGDDEKQEEDVPIWCVNLLNERGYEAPLSNTFKRVFSSLKSQPPPPPPSDSTTSTNPLNQAEYFEFDLNRDRYAMRYQKRIQVYRDLFDVIKRGMDVMGYAVFERDWVSTSVSGVGRESGSVSGSGSGSAGLGSEQTSMSSLKQRRRSSMGSGMGTSTGGLGLSDSMGMTPLSDHDRAASSMTSSLTLTRQYMLDLLTPVQVQNGVFRMNCLDCLDRTNMIQFMVSCRALLMMLRHHTAASVSIPLDSPASNDDFHISDLEKLMGEEGVDAFRQMWVRNGDALARHYTGTSALNTKFIEMGMSVFTGNVVRVPGPTAVPAAAHSRPGHASSRRDQPKKGTRFVLWKKLKDGMNALGRFYLNNVGDAYKQDALDLMLGYHRGTLDSVSFQAFSRRERIFRRVDPGRFGQTSQRLARVQSVLVLNRLCYLEDVPKNPTKTLTKNPSGGGRGGLAFSRGLSSGTARVGHWSMAVTFAKRLTIYFGLAIRHLAPKQLLTVYDWIQALVWVWVWIIWRIWVFPWLDLDLSSKHDQTNHGLAEDKVGNVMEGREGKGVMAATAVSRVHGWVWRLPKSGVEAWEGDDAPLKVHHAID